MIIDFHTHIFPEFIRRDRENFFEGEAAFESLYNSPKARLVGVRELITSMDKSGVSKSVIFGFPWENPEIFRRHNDYILSAVTRYPDRLVGLSCFSPLSPEIENETERCLKAGLSGVGELAVYGNGLTSEVVSALEGVMALCRNHNALFMLHTNEPVGHLYPGKTPNTLRQIYNFVKAYPQNRVILAHWGGGILFYALMKREVENTLQNVWFDTAASPYLYRSDMYRIAGEVAGFEKILFGSDYPLLGPVRYFKEMAASGISDEQMALIKGQSAEILLSQNGH